jgi:hypothetical protein
MIDGSSGRPPPFAAMTYRAVVERAGPLSCLVSPRPARVVRLAEAARFSETVAVSVRIHATGAVDTYREGVCVSEDKGQA